MYKVTNSLPSLLSVTRNGFQRSALPLPVLKYLSPSLGNLHTYKMTNKYAYVVESAPYHLSSLVNINVSTRASFSASSQTDVKKKITSSKTISELLDLFETSKNSLDIANSVTVLHTTAKIVWKDAIQRNELQKYRGSSQQGCSVFRDLLNHIADNIGNMDKEQKDDIVWALGKIQETNHRLHQMANK